MKTKKPEAQRPNGMVPSKLAGKQAYQLPGMFCPNCKSTGPFLLDPSDEFTIAADGRLEFPEDVWGLDYSCDCPACGFAGEFGDFIEWVEVTCKEREAILRDFLKSWGL